MRTLVRQGTFQITTASEEILFTQNLGACVAVGMVDEEAGVAGLLQYVLPETRGLSAPEGFPAFFAEEGIPRFVQEFRNKGGNPSRARVVVAGGGRFRSAPRGLDIGAKNVAAARFFLKRLGLLPSAEKVGESVSRRMEVSLRGGIKVYTLKEVESW